MSTRPMLKRFSCLRTTRNTATLTTTTTSTSTNTSSIPPARLIRATPTCLYQPLILSPHQHTQKRHLHRRIPRPPIPKPTPFIPDAQAFLTVIGRGLSQHASKIPNWEALFTLTSPELRELGVEPARSRRYLLRWLERFRNGRFGVGGDCTDVNEDGSVELRIVETPAESIIGDEQSSSSSSSSSLLRRATGTTSAGMRRVVVNLSGRSVGIGKEEQRVNEGVGNGKEADDQSQAQAQVQAKGQEQEQEQEQGSSETGKIKKRYGLQMHLQLPADEAKKRRVAFVSLRDSVIIAGPHVEPIKAVEGGAVGVARIARKEGLWEDKRGHKVNGGERRRANFLMKKHKEERKAAGLER